MQPRGLALAVVACAGCVLAACSPGRGEADDRAAPSATNPAAPSTVAIAATAAATTTTLASTTLATTIATTIATTTTAAPRPVTIAFGGDVHGEPPIRGLLDKGGTPFDAVAPLLERADLAIVNLETTIGTAGVAQDKEYVFRAPASLLAAARSAGVDVVSVANNHSWDYGRDGFVATLDAARASGLVAVGGGMTEQEAYAPALFDIRGTTVAVVGVARSGPEPAGRARGDRPGTTDGYDTARTVAAVAAAAEASDVVVVMIHMGTELERCPQADERDLVRKMLAAGATIVVGAHPHVLQGVVHDEGALVAYSVGNFVFYASRPEARMTGVLTVTVGPDHDVEGWGWDPARITSGRPVPLDGVERDEAIEGLLALAPGAGTCR